MPEISININMDVEAFNALCIDSQDWGVSWQIPGRFLDSAKVNAATPSWIWGKAYWVGPSRVHVLLVKAFAGANRRPCEVIWDTQAGVETSPGVYEGSYVVLTNYGS